MLHVRLAHGRAVSTVFASFAVTALIAAACGGGSSGGSTPTAAASPTGASATLDGYVANVCKATAAFETAATPIGRQADPSATPGNPATRAAGLVTAANAYLAALRADNPPPELVDYNNQLANEVQTAITAIGNGTFAGPGGGARNGAGGTPFARPSRTPGANASRSPFVRPSGTPGAGFPGARAGGGAVRLFLRNLPTPPAADAAQMDQLAAANTDCQAAGFSFATS